MAPPLDPKHQNEIITSAKSHSLKAAIFHTMALSYLWNSTKIKYCTLLVGHSSKFATMLPELVKNVCPLNNTTEFM